MPYNVSFISLGCAKNQVNCEQMMATVQHAGHNVVLSPEGADVAVVNTCGFLASACEEAIDNILEMAELKKEGKLEDMEQSDEINACSVIVPVEMDYGDGPVTEEWLVFFKNETHNHPTEIEPFGGAATCLGGAIRDPLSGRGYVYQAMRVTGAADPTVPVADTLKGKLSQKKLVRGAASGYSSYGNRLCKRNLSSRLCCKAYGDRRGYGCGSETQRHP